MLPHDSLSDEILLSLKKENVMTPNHAAAYQPQGFQPEANAAAEPLNGLKLLLLVLFFLGQMAGAPAQNPERMATAYRQQLVRVFEYRDSLEGVHPFIKDLHPIAIAEDGHFYVFDLNEQGDEYLVRAHEEIQMKVPKGVRAAFPLQFYDNKCACVVTGEVFDAPQGYVTIFHEFAHCHQWNTVEPALREKLPLAQKSLEKGDMMWEINYPFPYEDKWFVETYSAFIRAAQQKDEVAVAYIRGELATMLNDDDYQYMIWQEWKEGFALLIENRMRDQLGLPLNAVGQQQPYSRTVFYAGGSAFIEYLADQQPELLTDLEALFFNMY